MERGYIGAVKRSAAMAGVLILLAAGDFTPIAAAESKWIGQDGAGLAKEVFGAWKKTVREQGKHETLTHARNSAAAACIDWRSLQVAEGAIAFHFERWYAAWDESSTEASTAKVMASCEAWKKEARASCSCDVVAKGLRPALKIIPGMQSARLRLPADLPRSTKGPQLVLQAGHTGNITIAMLAPGWSQVAHQNGKSSMLPSRSARPVSHLDVLVTHADGVVIVWDRQTGQELRRTPKGSKITSLAMSANGAWLLGSDEGDVAHLWSIVSGAEVRTFQKSGFGIALSPDGSLAVIGSDDSTMRGVYETATGLQKFRFDIDDFSQAQFSPSGEQVLTFSFGGQISLWDVPRRRLLFRRYMPALDLAMFDATGRVIALGSQIRKDDKGNNLAFGTRLQVLNSNGHTAFEILREDNISKVLLTGDPDKLLLVGNTAEVWSLPLAKAMVRLAVEDPDFAKSKLDIDDFEDVLVTPNGTNAVSLHRRGALRIWDLATGTLLNTRDDPDLENARRLLLSAMGDEIFAQTDKLLTSWTFPDLQPLRTFVRNARIPRLSKVKFTSAGRLLVTSEIGAVLWDLKHSRPVSTLVPAQVDGTGPLARLVDTRGQILSELTGQIDSALPHPKPPVSVALSRDGERMAAVYSGGEVRVWNINDDELLSQFRVLEQQTHPFLNHTPPIALSSDGTLVAVADYEAVEIHKADSTMLVTVIGNPGNEAAATLGFSPSGERLLVGYEDGRMRVVDTRTGKEVGNLDLRIGPDVYSWDGDAVDQAVFLNEDLAIAKSTNGRFGDWRFDAEPRIKVDHNVAKELADQGNAVLEVKIPRVTAIAASPDARMVATGGADGALHLWNSSTGKRLAVLRATSAVVAVDFSPDGKLVVAAGEDGAVRLWRVDKVPSEIATLVSFSDDQWAAFSPTGRFDTNQIEHLDGLTWMMGDAPFSPFAPEIFMRDYFQPSLLAWGLSAVAPTSHLADVSLLNRVQSHVKIMSITSEPTADTVRVRVMASPAEDNGQPNGKTRTDAYDLRLFRDGQLVGRWPEGPDGGNELAAWRQRTRVPREPHDFVVALPTGQAEQAVSFTSYAFNEDRVKSTTAQATYIAPASVSARPRRAYVVTIGVDAYDAPERTLHFATSDARAMAGALSHLEGYEIVEVSLTSEGQDAKTWQATKSNIWAVLERLAGQVGPPGALTGVEGAERLAKATPDDLLIVTFSGHGYTTPEGRFFLLASDSGKRNVITPEVLTHFVSSDELSEWLRPIDAGHMVLIIDACHSAASVAQPGFKPGPMGDRGLGQLAYDKGLQVLAATQADDVALESAKVRQGLLTFALVAEGLALEPSGKRRADKDRDGRLTITEWLRFAEQRTPGLYDDIREGRLSAVYAGTSDELKGRNTGTSPAFRNVVVDRAQTPSLFDFKRRAEDVVLP